MEAQTLVDKHQVSAINFRKRTKMISVDEFQNLVQRLEKIEREIARIHSADKKVKK